MNILKQPILKTFLLVILCMTTESRNINAQIVDSGYVLFVPTPKLTSFPPLNTGMPLDVLIGYIYLDSLRRGWTRGADSMVSRLSDSDTLRQALKYLYLLDDYDPIKFTEYCQTSPSLNSYRRSGAWIRGGLLSQAAHVLRDTQHTQTLCHSDIIAHILVTGLESRTDSWKASGSPHQVVVSFQIIDTIKGRTLPSCSSGYFTNGTSGKPLTSDNCVQFCYSPQEPLTTSSLGDVVLNTDSMFDNLGNPWVKIGTEYIAFLSFQVVGSDSSTIYYSIFPDKSHTTQGGLYPVNGGIVSDPKNDFGLGIGLSTSHYLTALRSRIYSITHP